jgi:hypothetical protein
MVNMMKPASEKQPVPKTKKTLKEEDVAKNRFLLQYWLNPLFWKITIPAKKTKAVDTSIW